MEDVENGGSNTCLTDKNAAVYNTAFFAIKAKKHEVFSEAAAKGYEKYLPALSMLDDRIMLLPTGQLEPSFYLPNKVFHKSFLGGRHLDREMPIVMCVSKTSLKDAYDNIYGQGAAEATADMIKSLQSHTLTAFCDEIQAKVEDPSAYLEGISLGDDEVVLVFSTIIDTLHRLANNDINFKFTKETECTDVTLGPHSIKALSIFTGEKKSAEKYPVQKEAPGPLTMATGPALMWELRYILRAALKFGKGDTGTSKDEEGADATFESDLLTIIAGSTPPARPGALGLVSAYFHILGVANTITKTDRKYEIDTDTTAVWSMFAQVNLGSMTAMTVSHITCKDKGLKFHSKSANPLTNLQVTASRGSRTYCGLVLYLAKRVCQSRCSSSTLASVVNRSKQCYDCNSGENCAMAWTCVMTDSSSLAFSLTDAKKASMDGPSSGRVDQVFISEFNDQASPLGGAGSKNSAQKNAGKGFIEAHKKAMSYLSGALRVNKDGTSREAVMELGKALIKAQEYINGAEHRVPLMHRGECIGTKLETVLTDSDGGVPKMSLGLMGVPLARSKVLTYLSRIACNGNYKLAEFAAKPTLGLTEATSAVASKNIGVYAVKKDQDQVSVKTFFLHPAVQQDTDEVFDVNTEPKVMTVTVPGVTVKTTNKYKALNGVMKASDDCSVSFGGGMDFGAVTPAITPAQRASLRSSITWALLKAKSNFDGKAVEKSIESLINTVMAQPLGLFHNADLMMWDWDSLLSMFVYGAMMVANGYLVKPNFHFDGMTVPRFAMLASASKVELEPVSQRFLASGPTLVYARTRVDSFTGNVMGKATRFVSCSMSRFNTLKQFIGGNMLALNNTTMTGVFLPLKSTYAGGDHGFDMDETCKEISNMSGLSKLERCESVSRNAPAFIAKIRETNALEEGAEITFDHVYELFVQYSAQVLLDDPDMADMASHITDTKYVAAVCERVAREHQGKGEHEEEELDFNAMINKIASTTAASSSSAAASSGDTSGLCGDVSAMSLAEFMDN